MGGVEVLRFPSEKGAALVDFDGSLYVVKCCQYEPWGPFPDRPREFQILLDLPDQFKSGVEEFWYEGHPYLIRPFDPRPTLDRVTNFGDQMARRVVLSIAKHLLSLHESGVLYRDIRPSNFFFDGTPFDFGNAQNHGPTWLMDPPYEAPEILLYRDATTASEVYSLGVIYQRLRSGVHPFPDDRGTDSAVESYLWSKSLKPTTVLDRMCCFDPSDRPTMSEVVGFLENQGVVLSDAGFRFKDPPEGAPYAMVPLRSSVPHEGHLDLVSSILSAGFRPIVSGQMAGYFDADNPIPRCESLRALAYALDCRGWSPTSCVWAHNPYATEAETRLWFSMAPWDFRIVVSGNPSVKDLIGPVAVDCLFYTPGDFGCRGDSNGTKLRSALRSGDAATVSRMLPQPLADWPWLEYVCSEPRVNHVPVRHLVCIGSSRMYVRPYETPFDTVARYAGGHGWSLTPSGIRVSGREFRLSGFEIEAGLCVLKVDEHTEWT